VGRRYQRLSRRRSIAHLVYSENFVSPRARSSRSSYEDEGVYAPGKIKYVGKYDGNAYAAAIALPRSSPAAYEIREFRSSVKYFRARRTGGWGGLPMSATGKMCKIFRAEYVAETRRFLHAVTRCTSSFRQQCE